MLGLLGDEWTLLIAQQALLGATRYAEFADRLPISHAVLTRRLSMMTDAELLNRGEYQLNPPRYEYRLTGRGRSLWPVLVSIWDWERRWVPEHDLPALRHGLCGRTFSPELTCRACGSLADEKSLVAQWGPSGSWPRSMPVSATRRRSHGNRGGQAELFPQTMSILGNRWSFAVMVAAFVGTTRFTDFADQLGAPPGSLADRLQILVGNDVLTVSDGRYRLTEKGRAVLPVIVTALDWAQRWFATPEGPAVIVTHTRCANEFHAQLACDQCQESVRGSEIGQQPT
ncbi:winged helix-turn-helix transcriptional regulator [Mycolicibacterium llatzerense]|uniref:HxlR family transcriptional regulator n=1 Tax=Mycolicibacterium llatzerense TaxID=280871 RepID=A0A0D1JBF6_9MYCO|nr:helix-turn-helix domain-containing protein [Mycolicibacterium llatzerense]KIU18918.1 HxlR family transcriptional regulator [Mycolicibacterium llatzerense]MCT7369004.1 HxlR family transcriptional regulator [Mycolicibacterium llatzerense]